MESQRRPASTAVFSQQLHWLLGQTFIPNTNQPYKFDVFEVKDACFFDQGRTTEIYLPHQLKNQKLPILRNWARGERPQPSAWMVVQVP